MTRKETEDDAYDFGFEDGLRGNEKFTSLERGGKSPYRFFYLDGYKDGAARREVEMLANAKGGDDRRQA